jgi:hypothetical protein
LWMRWWTFGFWGHGVSRLDNFSANDDDVLAVEVELQYSALIMYLTLVCRKLSGVWGVSDRYSAQHSILLSACFQYRFPSYFCLWRSVQGNMMLYWGVRFAWRGLVDHWQMANFPRVVVLKYECVCIVLLVGEWRT